MRSKAENAPASQTPPPAPNGASAGHAIIRTDGAFRVLQANATASEVFSTPVAKGRGLGDVIRHRSLRGPALDRVARAVERDGAWEACLELRGDAIGSRLGIRVVDLVVTALGARAGGSGGFLLVGRDVTETRDRELRLLEGQRMEGVGLLAGGIAHDFNNILMGILGYASLAQDLIDADHPARRMLATIEQSAERAASLTSQLLAYASGGKMASVPMDMDELIDDTLNMLGSNLPGSIAIQRARAQNAPHVLGDPTQLQQVVMNLVLNAGEAIIDRVRQQPVGKGTGTISITTKSARLNREKSSVTGTGGAPLGGNFVVLQVRDDGCGMDEATVRRIFEPFFTTKFTGRGLGLAAVQGIIHNHGGGLVVASRPGQGTTFSVYLPATRRVANPVRADTPIALEGSETVLIIDDEAVARQLNLLTLANLGYRVLLAAGGEEGVDTYRRYQGEVSLIVLDLTMAGMGSHEVLAELAQMERQAPVLLTSGYDASSVGDLAAGRYMRGFLQKPYTPETLAKAVREILDEYKQ